MANISSFDGSALFPKSCEKELVEFIQNYEVPYYGVQMFDMPVEDGDSLLVRFWGSGRWTADSMFSREGGLFFNVEENPLAWNLIKAIEGIVIPMRYTDWEPGCLVLYDFDGSMLVTDSCVDIDGEFNNIAHNSRNLVNKGVEECAYTEADFDSLMEFVVKETGIEDDDRFREIVKNELNDETHYGVLTETDMVYFADEVAEMYRGEA